MNASLDAAVLAGARDLAARNVPAPDVFVWTSLGIGLLPGRLARGTRVPLARTEGIPAAWRESVLFIGEAGGGIVWILEDAPGAPEDGGEGLVDERPWTRAYPAWLAASAGAQVCIHASAGVALPVEGDALPTGSIALVRDHVNLSGRTPLLGLGASKLGPLFPDQSRTHHESLRASALAHARRLGIAAREAVAICTRGPALETRAERRFWARAGGDVAVAELDGPALACAHAGLSLLALAGVTDDGDGHADLRRIVERAERLAPAIEELVVACAPEAVRVAREERAQK